MKYFSICILGFFILMSSCNNKTDKGKTANKEDSISTTKNKNTDLNKTMDEMSEKTDALKKLKPLSSDELKALLPQTLDGINQTSYDVTNSMGYYAAKASYKKDDSTEISITIYDCAGEAGSGFYQETYYGQIDYENETSDAYTKTISFKGAKAIEHYEKDANESTLTFPSNKRFLVVITGKNMKPAEVRGIAGSVKAS